MYRIKASFKQPRELWQMDCERMKAFDPDSFGRIYESGPDQIALEINKRTAYAWQDNPPLPLGRDSVMADVFDAAIISFEGAVGQKFPNLPKVEVARVSDYLTRLNKLGDVVSKQLSLEGAAQLKSPPELEVFPSSGLIVIPDEFPMRIADDSLVLPEDLGVECPVRYMPWNREYLQHVLRGSMIGAIFRQLRGEWGDGFVKAYKDTGNEQFKLFSDMRHAYEIFVGEIINENGDKSGSLFTLFAKFQNIYPFHHRMRMVDYAGLEALSGKKTPDQMAMADLFDLSAPGYVNTWISPDHPNHVAKQNRFFEERGKGGNSGPG